MDTRLPFGHQDSNKEPSGCFCHYTVVMITVILPHRTRLDGGCHPGHPWERLPLTVSFKEEAMDYCNTLAKASSEE